MGALKAELRQCLAAISCGLGVFCSGIAFGWTIAKFEYTHGNSTNFEVSSEHISWIIALIQVGTVCTSWPIGMVMNHIGRKPAMLCCVPLFFISWLLIIYTRSVPVIFIARIIQGFGVGIAITVAPIYLSEVAGNKVRGMMGTVCFLGYSGGILSESVVACYLSYTGLDYFSFATPILFFIFFLGLPESPYFLLTKKRNNEAAKSLAWLRGEYSIANVEEELKTMSYSVEKDMKIRASFQDLISNSRSKKALFIVQTTAFVAMFSGTSAIIDYSGSIVSLGLDTTYSPDKITFSIITIQFFATFVNIAVIDKLGRRFLLMVPVVISAICHTLTGIFFYVKHNTSLNLNDYNWIPIVLILIFFACSAIGTRGVLPTIQAEFFPYNTRGLASSLTTLNLAIGSLVSVKLFQVITNSLGIHWNYFIFALVCMFGFCVTFLFIPESKGKSYSEIQESLENWSSEYERVNTFKVKNERIMKIRI